MPPKDYKFYNNLKFLNRISKNEEFIDFLHTIDNLDESTLRNTIFKRHKYIDIPGGFINESQDYSNNIIEYYYHVGGFSLLQRLWEFYKTNKSEVAKMLDLLDY